MLAAAGVLFAAVVSQGPHKQQALGVSVDQLKKLHPEFREAVAEDLERDVHAALDLVARLTFQLLDGEYAAACEPEVRAIVHTDGEKQLLIPVAGFKKP